MSGASGSALQRFLESMQIDYERWHDGIGYDLEALAALTPAERVEAERVLTARAAADWRDVEALAALGTPSALATLRSIFPEASPEIRLAIVKHAPDLIDRSDRVASLVQALEHADFYGGLSAALDQAAVYHPPPVVFAINWGLRRRSGEVAVHLAALMFYIHGRTTERFDMAERPFFLRFNTPDPAQREAAYQELCARLEIAPLPPERNPAD